eukprot:XP_001699334.1 predicted protein [Chlamydomonas reinhardtii]
MSRFWPDIPCLVSGLLSWSPGDLVQALTAAAAWRTTRPVGATRGVAWEEWVRQHLDPETQLREQPALEGLNSLAADIPETWLAAARAVQERLQAGLGPAPPSESTVVLLIMPCLGWRIPGISNPWHWRSWLHVLLPSRSWETSAQYKTQVYLARRPWCQGPPQYKTQVYLARATCMTRLQAQFNRNGSNYFEKAEGDQHEKKGRLGVRTQHHGCGNGATVCPIFAHQVAPQEEYCSLNLTSDYRSWTVIRDSLGGKLDASALPEKPPYGTACRPASRQGLSWWPLSNRLGSGGSVSPEALAASAGVLLPPPPLPLDPSSQLFEGSMSQAENNVGGGETITGTGFYGTINAACTMQIFLVLFGILSGAFAWPVMFDAGVGLGRPLVAAFTRGLCAYAYGNDSCPSRVDKAIKFMRMFVEFIKSKGVNVTAQFLARRPAVFAMTMEDMAKVPQGLEGVTHVFTFWQGIPASAKDALGAMFAASSTTVGIAVVDKGAGVLMERQLGQHGFGPLELVKQFAVRMYGSNSQKQVWVFKKPGAVYRELPEEKLVDYAPYVHQPHLPVPPRIEWMHALYQAALAEEARKYKLSVAEGKGERDRRPPQRFGFS